MVAGRDGGVVVQLEGPLLLVRSGRDIVVERCHMDLRGESPASGRETAQLLTRT